MTIHESRSWRSNSRPSGVEALAAKSAEATACAQACARSLSLLHLDNRTLIAAASMSVRCQEQTLYPKLESSRLSLPFSFLKVRPKARCRPPAGAGCP
jgi:hypothetical protein